MSRVIDTIEGCDIIENDDGTVEFTAKLAIDDDGSDNRWRDPCWQPETSLKFRGKSIDAGSVPYIVVPPAIILGVARIVLGCRAVVTLRGNSQPAVTAEVGPHHKLGEGSVELARRLRVPESPVSGGDPNHEIHFKLWPGMPAVVDGITYNLQPALPLKK